MALTSTMYNFEIELSDADRNVYEQLKFTVAQHPSESPEFMTARVVAFCLEYSEHLGFSKGLGEPDEPAISSRSYDGRIRQWIDIGIPDFERIHKAAKIAERVAVYVHRGNSAPDGREQGKKVFRGEEIPIFSFDPGFLEKLSRTFGRRTIMSMSRSEGQLYVAVGNDTLISTIHERAAA